MRKVWLGAAAAVIALPFGLVSASAAPCVADTVAAYEAAGFSCNVGGVTFSNINIAATPGVILTGFAPTAIAGEFGLILSYSAAAGLPGTTADVNWTYDVAGNLLADAGLSLTGGTTGNGVIAVTENLFSLANGSLVATMVQTGNGSTFTNFAPIAALFANKDQADIANNGSAFSSSLTNVFSLATPIPGALPLLATGLFGLVALRRKRRAEASQSI
jgi:hypothetical protein